VQLNREWKVEPEKYEFAPSVKGGTLISLIQNGLLYDDLLAEAQGSVKQYTFIDQPFRRPAVQVSTIERPPPRRPSRAGIDGHAAPSENVDVVQPAVSQSCVETPDDAQVLGDDAMDVDKEAHAAIITGQKVASSESPVKPDAGEEPTTFATTLELGNSVGIQSESRIEYSVPEMVINTMIPGSDIVHLTWHPQIPSHFMATGGSIWRRWEVPASPSAPLTGITSSDFGSAAANGKKFYIDAVAWSPCGEYLALVMETEISLYGKRGTMLKILDQDCKGADLSHNVGTVLSLRWNSDSTLLLAASSIVSEAPASSKNEPRGRLTVWNIELESLSTSLSTTKPALDACWVPDNGILACGEHFIVWHDSDKPDASPKQMHTDIVWDKVAYEQSTNTALFLAPEAMTLGIWDLTSLSFRQQPVHESLVSSFALQPLQARYPTRFVATCCVAGNIKLWSYMQNDGGVLECVQDFHMENDVPAMAVAFSPGGDKIAAAGGSQIQVWEARVGGKILAKWEALSDDEGRNGDAMDTHRNVNSQLEEMEDDDEEPFHTLSWNSDGTRLAYGRDGNRVTDCLFGCHVYCTNRVRQISVISLEP